MRKNIILTTMSTLPWNLPTNYYLTENAQRPLFCDGIAQTEAGTKFFLSQVRIDHIVVIGSDKTYCSDESVRDQAIDSFSTPDLVAEAAAYSNNVGEYSYRYYKYRIAQFLQHKNAEQSLLAESIPEERRNYLQQLTSEYMISKGYTRPNMWFSILASGAGSSSLSGGLRNKIDSDIKSNFISEDQYAQYLQPVSSYPELIRLEEKIDEMKEQIEAKTLSLEKVKLDLHDRYFSSRAADLDYEARLFILSRRLEENITSLEIEQYITKSAVYRDVILVLKDAVDRLIMQVQALKSNRLAREFTYIKSWLYQQLEDSFILKPAKENTTTSLTFVPDMLSSGSYNISGIINAIRSIAGDVADTTLDLYIDMQGGSRTDSYVKNAILSIFNNDKNSRIFIQKVVATDFESRNFANTIVDETDRYRVTDLTAGMNAFIQYGRADLIDTYLKKLGIKRSSHTGKLVAAMVEIDHALSICNITALTKAINSIRAIFDEPVSSDDSEAAEIFRVLENGIRQDYGDLIKDAKIDYYALTQWAFRKGFLQQALTIIESKMPGEFVRRGICFYADNERAKNVRILRELYRSSNKTEKAYFDNIDNYFLRRYMYADAVKNHNRSLQSQNKRGQKLSKAQSQAQQMTFLLNSSSPDVISVRTNCSPKRMTALLEKYYAVADLRNNVNHSNEENPSFTYPNITQAINSFLTSYKNVLDNMGSGSFHVNLITAAEIIEAR